MSQIFEISKANSFRFSKIRNINELKNDNNTLSGESLNLFPYIDIQRYLNTDIITTQFKTNYANQTAILVTGDSKIAYDIVKKTTNIGREKSYDARYYNYKGGGVYTGVYFTFGNEYTYGTSTVIGSHSFNGELPEFAIVGDKIDIAGLGNQLTIVRIIYDDIIDAKVMLVSNAYTGIDATAIVKSQYNLLPYEVYEFTIDLSITIGECYVLLYVSDNYKRTLYAKSEIIDVQTEHPNALEIVYYNDDNDDILYSTGIKHKIRPLYNSITTIPDNNNEINLTDTTAVLIDSNIYDKNKFLFAEVGNELLNKYKLALSSNNVIINQEGYVIGGAFSVENFENTNMYTLEATMIKTNANYYVDETLNNALSFKDRVLVMSGGATVDFNCILADFDADVKTENDYYIDEDIEGYLSFKTRVLAMNGGAIVDINCILADFNAYY